MPDQASQSVSPARWEIRPEDASYQADVLCVVMPCCGFTYDAIHTTEQGIYSCPLCEPQEAHRCLTS